MTIEKTEVHELRAFVANCLMGGATITRDSDNPDNWTRDCVVFECDGREFKFLQKPEVIKRNFDSLIGRCVETTEVIVADVSEDDVDKIKLAIERICWLLSFVSTCRVIPFGYEYPNGSGRKSITSVSGSAENFRPVFEIGDGQQVKKFVEQVYEKYAALESSRNLKVVFDYLAQAEVSGQLLEVRLILSYTAIENLKYTFAKKMGLVFENSWIRTKSTDGKGKIWTYKELVPIMLTELGMTYNLDAAYELRNDLIHSGLSHKIHGEQQALYEDVHDLIREYLLRLLGYKGHYSPYARQRPGTSVEIT